MSIRSTLHFCAAAFSLGACTGHLTASDLPEFEDARVAPTSDAASGTDAAPGPDAADAAVVDAAVVDVEGVDAGGQVPADDAAIPPDTYDSGIPPGANPFGDDPDITVVERGIGHVEGPTYVPEENGFVYNTRGRSHVLWRIGESDTSQWHDLPGGNHGSHYYDGYVYLANRRPAEIARIRVSDNTYERLDSTADLDLPNDIDMFSDGSVYFSDWGGASRSDSQIGVYRRFTDGRTEKVIDSRDTPNGVQFSADCQSLFVTDHPEIFRWDVAPDGTLSNERLFYRGPGFMNGITVDERGNVYTVRGDGVTAIDDNGDEIGELDLPGTDPVNLAFGGPDRQTLLVTTTDGVFAVRMLVGGAECHGSF